MEEEEESVEEVEEESEEEEEVEERGATEEVAATVLPLSLQARDGAGNEGPASQDTFSLSPLV